MRFFYAYASRFTACFTTCLFCLSFSASVQAECPDDAAIALYLAAYAKGIPAAGFGPGLSDEDAECAKFKLAKQLPKHLGALSGYKLGFVSQASRKLQGSEQPRWGFMFERNLIDILAVIPANFGAYPGFDASLMVEVKDAGLADALAAFNVNMVDESRDGQVLGTGRGDVLMGHPLNAAILLAKAIKLAGIALKPGDVLCLGSLIEPQPPRAGMKIKLQYLGLPGDPELELEFSEAFDRGR